MSQTRIMSIRRLLRRLFRHFEEDIKGRVPPFLHKVVLRRANQPHNSHEDRFSMLWPSRTQSPPKSQITMVKVSGKHIWWHQICLPDTLTIVIWLLGGDCVRLGQSIEKRSSWELWGWFALLKTTLCKKGGTLPLNEKVKHFVFDLTCDITGDSEVKFLNFIWKISSRPFHCRLNFSSTSVGFRDRYQQRVGTD